VIILEFQTVTFNEQETIFNLINHSMSVKLRFYFEKYIIKKRLLIRNCREVTMKKLFPLVMLLMVALILSSCSPAEEEQITDDIVATQVSIILTETAIHQEPTPTSTPEFTPTIPEPVEEPTPTEAPTETPTVTPTSTFALEDPAQLLGSPAWTYDFSGDTSPWDFESTQALYRTANGYLNMTARANANWHNWWISSPQLKNAYVEATLQMSACAGADRFGLAVRGSADGQQFYFMGITCDGRWGLFRMAENVDINTIIGYREADPLTAGLEEPHRVGIWMKDNNFTLFINGVEVGQATDTTLTNPGFTGFLIAFANTPGFTVRVDQLRYWNVP
jgi:hypothetical protein